MSISVSGSTGLSRTLYALRPELCWDVADIKTANAANTVQELLIWSPKGCRAFRQLRLLDTIKSREPSRQPLESSLQNRDTSVIPRIPTASTSNDHLTLFPCTPSTSHHLHSLVKDLQLCPNRRLSIPDHHAFPLRYYLFFSMASIILLPPTNPWIITFPFRPPLLPRHPHLPSGRNPILPGPNILFSCDVWRYISHLLLLHIRQK